MLELENCIGHAFENKDLLITALTHSSYANENKAKFVQCNERLEFLGDAVLGVIVAEYLYSKFPDLPEGRMTRLRSELVCERNLSHVAVELNLGENLLLGRGEERSGGGRRPSILADAVEAVIAAVYLDGGKQEAEKFVYKFILSGFEAGDKYERDYKTELQEFIQRKAGQVLTYKLTSESGPDHEKVFTVDALLNGQIISSGRGHSKKDAEQAAARSALEELR